MKALVFAPAAVLVAALSAAPALADPGADSEVGASGPSGPSDSLHSLPFIDHAEWAQWGRQSSLRVYPTSSGRQAARQLATPAAADEAWAEVLVLSPDADSAGMRAQFLCHWQFAEMAHPGKVSWNLEPWRPVVDNSEMLASGCNPGSVEERF